MNEYMYIHQQSIDNINYYGRRSHKKQFELSAGVENHYSTVYSKQINSDDDGIAIIEHQQGQR